MSRTRGGLEVVCLPVWWALLPNTIALPFPVQVPLRSGTASCAYAGVETAPRIARAKTRRIIASLLCLSEDSSIAFHRLHDLLRSIIEVIARGYVEPGLLDDLLAEIDIGAFEPHHQRHLQPDFLHRGDNAFGDHVAFHDAAEDVDQDALHVRIGGDDLERGRNLVFRRAAA